MEHLLKSKDLQHEGLQEIIRLVQAGEMPSEQQIQEIKSYLVDDRVVSRSEAELLFYLKREFPDIVNVGGFDNLFVNGVTSFLLYTGETPGVLDNVEFVWLSDHFAEDHEYDDLEKQLLMNLSSRAEQVPTNFHELVKNFSGDGV